MANASTFKKGDIVTVCIPRRYADRKWLYSRFGLSESERYVVSDIRFGGYSKADDLIDWRYELDDSKFSFIPESWLSLYGDEEDEEISASDINILLE